MATVSTNLYRVFKTEKSTSTGACSATSVVKLVNGSVAVAKNPRASRPKPVNLLAKTSMTAQARQSITRLWRGFYTVRTSGTMLCLGKWPMITWVQYQELQLSSSYLPTLVWPTIDWGQEVRLKVAQQQVSFAENIGEYRESLEQLEGVGRVLRKAAFSARRIWRNRKSRRKFVRQLRREWERAGHDIRPKTPFEWRDAIGTHLALNFGILPTLGQLEDVLDQLDSLKQRTIKVQVTMKEDAKPVVKTWAGNVGSAVVTGTKSQRALVYVRFQDTHGDFTAGNLASSIWAGIPLSFMVDWAIGVGRYLESLTALSGVEEVWGTLTTKYSSECVRTAIPTGAIPGEPLKLTYRAHQRDVISAIPFPKRVRVQIPEWNVGKFISSLEIFSSFRR